MLNSKITVDMPKHCVKVSKNGTTYIQYTVRAYRNKKGQPTSDRVAIGKLDEASGRLIPNRNYYELFEKKPEVSTPEYVRSCGTYTVFSGVARKLGIEKLLEKHFPDKAKEILTVAHYMLCEGNVMYYLEDWQDGNVSYSKDSLSGAEVSRVFSRIGEKERLSFFSDWMKQRYSNEYIAYDVTSVSTYSKGMESAEWGYNRDKEKLPQINLGMYYGEDSGLPLYYRVSPGSITDKTHLRYMIEDNSIVSNKRAHFVMDRGFYSAANLQFLTEQGCRFLIALPDSLKYCRELIDRHGTEIVNHSECYLGEGKPYGKAYEVNELGFRMRVHLYYTPEKAARDGAAIQEELAQMERELMQMEEPPDRKLNYGRYFFINRSKDGKLGFRRNFEAIDQALSRAGFFLIAETDFKKTTAEVLDIYRRRDVIEKSFDDLKNDLDMDRLYVHGDATAAGKIFCAFIALVVRSQMHNALGAYLAQRKFTFQKLLLELDKLKLIIAPAYPNGCRLLNPPSRTFKDISELLGLPPISVELVC